MPLKTLPETETISFELTFDVILVIFALMILPLLLATAKHLSIANILVFDSSFSIVLVFIISTQLILSSGNLPSLLFWVLD